MDKFSKLFLVLISSFLLFAPSQAQDCSYTFSNNVYTACNRLPALSSFIHWNYHQANNSVDIAYRHTGVTTSNWVAWALNPGTGRMDGAQSLIAFRNSTGLVYAYTSPITGYSPTMQPGTLSFRVPSVRAEFVDNQMILYATIELPQGRTSFTHVWQHGDLSGDAPQAHPFSGDHVRSYGAIDFATGITTNTGAAGEGSRQRKRNVHGVLNVVSWGILMPLGAMAARLGHRPKTRQRFTRSGANDSQHRHHPLCPRNTSGIRPASEAKAGSQIQILLEHIPPRDRIHRNQSEHCQHIRGFDILDPEKKWKQAYIGVLIFLGVNAVLLEAFTWFVVLKRKRGSESDKYPHAANGMNGVNGYGA
ncbi:UNVERIFIED_CONTAM: cytochrome and DOMON domain-containing protein [Sesamum calycinum]|uniref:Cytochrome and DOMON domain-containing protein n=1 Tax=Sesamum calycinum TaxID=2727403 RepID=A0AAW2Q2W5_9LAMI